MTFVTMLNVLLLAASPQATHEHKVHASTAEPCAESLADDVYCKDGERECLVSVWKKNGKNCEGEHADIKQGTETMKEHEEHGGMQHSGEKTACRSNAQCGLGADGDVKTRDRAFVCLHAQLGEGGIYRYNYRCNDRRVPEGSACFCQKLIGGEVLHWQYQPVKEDPKAKTDKDTDDDRSSHTSTLKIPTLILGFSFMML